MGCELNRQLNSPWRGCRAGSSMAMDLVKESLEMEFQLSGVHELCVILESSVSWQQRFVRV